MRREVHGAEVGRGRWAGRHWDGLIAGRDIALDAAELLYRVDDVAPVEGHPGEQREALIAR